jgi:hypothetical protein
MHVGAFMKEDDIYIGTFLDLFNLRFAPEQTVEGLSGGISEMVFLQGEFQIFQKGRTFADSAKLLGLGGYGNNKAKNRWFDLLVNLTKVASDKAGETGDQRIVNALIANLGKKKNSLPCYMMAHDSREKDANRVYVRENDRPLFYLEQLYLTISLPMKPRLSGAKKSKKK